MVPICTHSDLSSFPRPLPRGLLWSLVNVAMNQETGTSLDPAPVETSEMIRCTIPKSWLRTSLADIWRVIPLAGGCSSGGSGRRRSKRASRSEEFRDFFEVRAAFFARLCRPHLADLPERKAQSFLWKAQEFGGFGDLADPVVGNLLHSAQAASVPGVK